MNPLRVAFAGTPAFAVPALRALVASPHEVVAVLTQPDRPKGRGQRVVPGPVSEEAARQGLTLLQPLTLRDEGVRRQLAALELDAMVVVAYGLILPRDILGLPRLGCINIHASLLPRWRGAAPIQRAILAGDETTGVTIMLMDEGLDTGPILSQHAVPITREDTAGSLHDRLAELGASALLESLEAYARSSLTPRPQPTEGVTYAEKVQKSEALIDWSRSAPEIERQVRAFNPWPVAETRLDGEQLRILRARGRENGSSGSTAGTVLAVSDDGIEVACGRGILTLTEVQRAGRRPVSARAFANACPVVGRKLG